MRIVLLGTGGFHPNERRHTPCMLIPELGIALDAGTAAFRLAGHLRTDELNIFLSHTHLDHVVGLTYLLGLPYVQPMRKITVHAMPECLAAIDEHLFAAPIFPKKPAMELKPLAAEVALAEGGRLTHFPLAHPGQSRGFRLQWPGHSLAYVTDTTADAQAGYADEIQGVDLLLHECNFPDGFEERARQTGHSCVSEVARLARRAGVGRLVLVHVNPAASEDDPVGIDKARAIFPKSELGQDLMELEF